MRAIQQFSEEAAQFLVKAESPIILVPIPPSKTSGHPEYDGRIEQVARKIADTVEEVNWSPLLYRTRDIESHHASRDRRDPEQIYRDLSINEPYTSSIDEDHYLVLLDDVITSGAHFSAARRRLQDRFSNIRIGGLFWANAQRAEDFYCES